MLNFLPDALPDSNSTLSEQQEEEEEEEEGRWALSDRAAAAVKSSNGKSVIHSKYTIELLCCIFLHSYFSVLS